MTDLAISTPAAPLPAHAFSQAVLRGPFLQVSGQGPVDPVTKEFVSLGDAGAQTLRTLQNVEAILAAGGAGFGDVLQVRVYLSARDDFAAMNAVYDEFMRDRVGEGLLPARTTVMTGLPYEGMLVEIDALAVLED
jgi:2-iminobutanoate/2-iminopropanoate deaminase